MAYKLIIKALAEKDISEASDFYYKQAPHIFSEFLGAVNSAIELLLKDPRHFQKRYKEVRIIFIKKFPFGLYYTINGSIIYVHAVLHTRRDPDRAIGRL